jgi:hypothetical protein
MWDSHIPKRRISSAPERIYNDSRATYGRGEEDYAENRGFTRLDYTDVCVCVCAA